MPSKSLQVVGYCPMGCGQTLVLSIFGRVTCAGSDCPNPVVVDELLANSETEHIVVFGEEGFTVQHPLREHLGDLFDCRVFEFLKTRLRPETKIGRYRVKPAPRLSGDEEQTYEFEELPDVPPDD